VAAIDATSPSAICFRRFQRLALVLASLLVFLLLPPGFIITVVGVGYPSVGTLQCIEGKDEETKKQWLSYWVVYALFSFIMGPMNFLFSFIPFFFYIKIGFLVWCMMPNTKGATKLYEMAKPKLEAVMAGGPWPPEVDAAPDLKRRWARFEGGGLVDVTLAAS